MAKKKSVKSASMGGLLTKIACFAAFIGLFCAGIAWIFGFIPFLSIISGPLQIIGMFLVLVSVVISGWNYLQKTNLPGPDLVWLIFFIVFAVLAFVGTINV
ncbi:MAG: hypothetical protein R3Y05_05215 [bacterium]